MVYRAFEAEGAEGKARWHPTFDRDMNLTGYELVTIHPTKRPHAKRRRKI